MASQGAFNGHFCGFFIAHFPYHDHIGIVTQNMPQGPSKAITGIMVYLNLSNAVYVVFHRVFHSDDIHVGGFSFGGSVSNKAEFTAALHQFKQELETARAEGLDDDTADDVLTEVEAAEREAKKEIPRAERIVKRLTDAQAILKAGTGVATSAKLATNKLMPMIESAIQLVSQIF